MRALQFLAGVLLLLVPEILRVYYIMPFPGSQEDVATDLRQVSIAYWLHNHIWWVRLIGLALVVGPFIHYLRNGNWWKRIAVILPAALCALVFYAFNFKFMADKMFHPPKEMVMRTAVLSDSTANSLVIAVERNGDARAYPIELIGYHHQVLDTIGGEPVLVTYCTVCRTGRAWKPVVNGEPESFRLVGMDHFNAMFEDSRTGSWWRQVSGECILGPLKGQQLEEVPSQQLTLAEFAQLHPKGLVFQPDNNFTEQYTGLEGFDEGTITSSLEYRDSASWQMKSWVVGVVHNGQARAYDWNDLQRLKELHDTLANEEILVRSTRAGPGFVALTVRRDTAATSTYGRLTLAGPIRDSLVISERIDTLPSYQEFWHSWRTFHPNTTRYEPR
ncbi:MAG: DUF3179 domain-containing protein [Flavobacteriales bacterium]|nr:DUF3179 domain-containing protein [Flavobacteriales bacterium]